MSRFNEIRERRGEIAKEVRRFVDSVSAGNWNDECQNKYDTHMNEIEALDKQLSAMQKVLDSQADRELKNAISELGENPHFKAFDRMLRVGKSQLNFDEIKILNTMSTTTGSEGGYTVPSLIFPAIVNKMKDFSAMRSVATIIPTSSGEAMPIPVSDGTAEEGEIVAQNGDPADADPTFAQVDWSAYAYSSKVVTAPEQLLQDSVFDMQAFIFDRVSERLGRITNKHYTIGTGSSQPLGIVAASAAGRVGASGQTATILYNDLVDLSESVDVAYLRNGVGKFMMSQTMRAVIRKLKDDQNLPIFLPGYQLAAGVATDTLMGYELVINNSMATPAASAKTVIFGDFKKYYIRDVVNSLRMNRYDDSAYAKKYQVGFQGWMRTGGTLSDTASVKHYVHAAS